MRGTLIIIILAVLGFFGYQYTQDGEFDMQGIFEPVICPNGYGPGDVVEHITGNFHGMILNCGAYAITVELGNGSHSWVYDEVVETRGAPYGR